MTFNQRLAKYKKETDYFAINLFHNSERPYKTIHDLTWQDAHVKLIVSLRKVTGSCA